MTRKKTNETANKPTQTQPVYAFLTQNRCPRCKSTDTVARSTQGKWQYRECQVAVCRTKYHVEGKSI